MYIATNTERHFLELKREKFGKGFPSNIYITEFKGTQSRYFELFEPTIKPPVTEEDIEDIT